MTLKSVFVRTFSALSLFIVCLAATLHPALAQNRTYRYDTITLSGEPLPGTGGVAVEYPFGFDLNNDGELIFTGIWSLGGFEGFTTSLWRWRQGLITPIAVQETPVPGVPGEVFGDISGNSPRLNAAGNVAFITVGSSTAINRQSLYSGTPDSLSLIAREGEPAPGAGGLLFETLDMSGFASAGSGAGPSFLLLYGPNLNNSGDFVFMAHLADCIDCGVPAVREDGLWLNTANGLELLALTGDPAPGTPSSSFAKFLHYSLNDSGEIAFRALLDDTTSGNQGLWFGTPGNFSLIAKTGDEAPGTNGLTFTEFASEAEFGPTLSASGDFLFRAFVNSGDPNNDSGLWLFRNGTIEPVVRTGEPAPGTAGVAFEALDEPQINSSGTVAFRGILSAAGPGIDDGIWLGTAEAPDLVVRSGDDAPGTAGQTFVFFSGLGLNALGELAFQAAFEQTSTSFSSSTGVWVESAGNIEPVLRPGRILEVRPGAFRTVKSVSLLGNINNEAGLVTSFNDNGQVLVSVLFDDWSEGILLATPLDPGADQSPVADAGPDRTTTSLDTITLDGTGSFDPEGGPLTYRWSLDGIQIGTGAAPVVGPFETGTFTVFLAVTDESGQSHSDSLSLTVEPPNTPPVADAGIDRTLHRRQTVFLTGFESFDPDGDALSYLWTLDGVEIGTERFFFMAPLPLGIHVVTLTVTDSRGASSSDTVTMTVANRAPIAHAGPDRTVNTATPVNLNGTSSHDPDGEPISYVWTLDGTQVGSGIIAPVGPFAPGSYTIVMTITDPLGASASDSLVITVINDSPVANAGADATIQTLETATLNGTGSADPDGEALSYSWRLSGVEIGTGVQPTVGPFAAGSYVIDLTVTDAFGATASDSVNLTVLNRAPAADAGPDQTVQGPQAVILDGSGSADPDGDALSYSWSLGGVEIATVAQPNVGPFDEGSYVFTLTVTDPAGATSSDSVTLTVQNAPPIASAGPDQTIVTSRRRKRVTLDGSASSDLDGTIVSYVWRLNGSVLGNGVSIRPRLRRGTNTVVLTVTDDDGASSTDEVVITIAKRTQVSSDD